MKILTRTVTWKVYFQPGLGGTTRLLLNPIFLIVNSIQIHFSKWIDNAIQLYLEMIKA